MEVGLISEVVVRRPRRPLSPRLQLTCAPLRRSRCCPCKTACSSVSALYWSQGITVRLPSPCSALVVAKTRVFWWQTLACSTVSGAFKPATLHWLTCVFVVVVDDRGKPVFETMSSESSPFDCHSYDACSRFVWDFDMYCACRLLAVTLVCGASHSLTFPCKSRFENRRLAGPVFCTSARVLCILLASNLYRWIFRLCSFQTSLFCITHTLACLHPTPLAVWLQHTLTHMWNGKPSSLATLCHVVPKLAISIVELDERLFVSTHQTVWHFHKHLALYVLDTVLANGCFDSTAPRHVLAMLKPSLVQLFCCWKLLA